MSLWSIAWKSIKQRGLASALTMLSMALGVMMVVGVLTIHGVVEESFRKNSSLGYNMIVGGKGGKLQLTLNSVFYLSRPIEPIPYEYFLEFQPAEARAAGMKNSLAHAQHEAQVAALELAALQNESAGALGIAPLTDLATADVMDRSRQRAMEHQRDGRFSLFTEFAVPVCLGDYYGKFRVVGTTPQMFEMMSPDEEDQPMYEFAQGRNFQTYNDQHGWYEAVLGNAVAREMKVKLGEMIYPIHGDPEKGGHAHDQGFTVVGILKPSGTPNDRGAFINLEGFYLMDGHAKPVGDEETRGTEMADADHPTPAPTKSKWPAPLLLEKREVSAFLVRTTPFAIGLDQRIDEGPVAQAVLPLREITNLMEFIVKPIQQILLVLTFLICLVSGVSILVSIYNSMNDRRRDIAIMRALGAGRTTVFLVILCESLILAVGGGLLGMLLGHTLNAVASPIVVDYTGVTIGFLNFAPGSRLSEWLPDSSGLAWDPRLPSLELLIVPAIMLLAVIVGLIPAWSAYRTDVSKSLAP